ncbi:hypothetical protein BS50DRAFT_341690 [Corynespora cassiicola Philippines]|uniref:Uncharacterized protein n=1 Tax=Corynespora cassiicola Philippines TaxID=1448308 RepID=A0A2T2NVX0_CORCC|nr:hypothetical protein BS50DRAFT_341690 [Corynespora cassiicola Philippines]
MGKKRMSFVLVRMLMILYIPPLAPFPFFLLSSFFLSFMVPFFFSRARILALRENKEECSHGFVYVCMSAWLYVWMCVCMRVWADEYECTEPCNFPYRLRARVCVRVANATGPVSFLSFFSGLLSPGFLQKKKEMRCFLFWLGTRDHYCFLQCLFFLWILFGLGSFTLGWVARMWWYTL